MAVEEHTLKVLCSARNSKTDEDPGELWGHSCPSTELSFVPSNHPVMPVWCPRLMSSCPIGLSAPWGGFSPWNRLGAGGWRSTHTQTHCCWWAPLMRGHLVSIHEISKLSMGTSGSGPPEWAGQGQPEQAGTSGTLLGRASLLSPGR